MTTDKIISISSVIIALTAVCVSIWQGVETREHNKLSLKPYITSAPVVPGVGGENGIFVSNDGMGLALIKEASILANGKVFDLTINSWPAIYEHLHIKKMCHSESWFKTGTLLKSGEKIKILSPTSSPLESECPVEFIKLLSASELKLHLVYESIYEEKYEHNQSIGFDKQEIDRFKQLLSF